ncbi:hypothetical protein AQUCO_03000004v1 [Aquilegia coerulea]|uniref:Acyl-CoA-binding domain-containing protein n=1 Tax=Aquilegia coerulea TaxID=218851 RepID=A0A2G5D1R7_AQUCA|nr:hypothetical protein AQUCO_03000004v1 [Aquilegia coerulea]PIA37128.1 hypothetical protein AQUCO_03000004v1 [Aquilegia coerulea]PIA37129.1 hypothetical protein AQUCO_03000004v1 [Aquilegia coerulea]
MGIEENNKTDMNINNWISELGYDKWSPLPVTGSRPSARYKHGAAVADGKLYIVGGSRNGRHLADVQVFDLRTLAWSRLNLHADPNSTKQVDDNSAEILPAISGHSLVHFGSKLFVVGGHSKAISDSVTVWSIDVETHHCHVVETSGKAPISRAGQSVTLVGSKLIMFGGEHASRQLLNDIHILDLEAMTWDVLETMNTPPAPRFDHIAAVHSERYLLIFGGCSHSTCFNDLHILDLQTKEWSQPQTQGDVVTPRAGHAGVTIDGTWYILGGGDNTSGASDTLVLNLSKLVWSVLTNVEQRDPLASEGLSLCFTSLDEEKLLIAFGGYNGKYNSEVFVLRPKPSDSARPKIFQSHAAAAAAASVTAAYALNSKGERKLDLKNTGSEAFKGVQSESLPQVLTDDTNTMKAEKKTLELSISEVRTENLSLKEALDEMKGNHDELSKELLSVRGQLKAEMSRCSKLEVQIAELQKSLESLQSIEDELKVLRKQRTALEQDMDFGAAGVPQRQSSGVWQWIGGGTQSS